MLLVLSHQDCPGGVGAAVSACAWALFWVGAYRLSASASVWLVDTDMTRQENRKVTFWHFFPSDIVLFSPHTWNDFAKTVWLLATSEHMSICCQKRIRWPKCSSLARKLSYCLLSFNTKKVIFLGASLCVSCKSFLQRPYKACWPNPRCFISSGPLQRQS